MAKRNWDDISKDLATTLKEPGPTKKPKQSCYDIDKDNIICKTTNKYLYDTFYSKNVNTNTQHVYIRNNINNKDVRASKDTNITIGNLADYFGKIGHCLSYKIAASYVTKLMFDFDCKKCKLNTCNSLIESEVLQMIGDDVSTYIQELIKNPNAACVIFKKATSCNLHFYFNISVSLPMLELLRKRLLSHLDEHITDKYIIDDIYTLDLPYSTKNGFDIYQPAYTPSSGVDYKQFSCLPNDREFYDVELKLSIDEVYDTHITLGSFTSTYTSEWNEDIEYVKHIITPLTFKPILVKSENTLISNIKLSRISNFRTQYTLIAHYLEVPDTHNTVMIGDHDLNDMVDEGDDRKILHGLLSLGETIGKKLYEPENKLNNLLRLMLINDGTMAFYVICSIIFHIHKTHNFYTIGQCKKVIIKILLMMVKHSSQSNNDVILHILHSLETYDCIINLEHAFMNSDEWLNYLTRMAKIESLNDLDLSLNDKRINLIILQLKIYNTLEALIEELVNLCKLLIPIIKVEYGLSKFHYYIDDGVYITISSDKFFNQNTVQIQMVEALLKKLVKKLVVSKQVPEEVGKRINMKDIWISYFESLTMSSPKFNFYDYFIATDLGVFNTLTGLYMSHTPLLHMNTKKSYCRIPTSSLKHVNSLSMAELNSYIIKEGQDQLYSNTLRVLIHEQKKIFYGSVMIPGLLCMDTTLYSKAQEEGMLQLVYKHVVEDTSLENEKLLYFTEVLIQKYSLSVHNLIHVGQIIQHNIEALGVFNRDDLYRYCMSNGLEASDQVVFRQNEDLTMYDQLTATYPTFRGKLFALAVVLGVFEVAHPLNSKLTMFEWVNDRSIKLSTHHMFNDIDYNLLSMKTYENIKRVLTYLTPHDNIPQPMLNLVTTISTMLAYDAVAIVDFLSVFSMIYHHNSKRKKVVLLIGSPNSGKSTYQHMLFDMHGKSAFSVNSIIQAEGQGPSPEIVNALSKYLFSIIELKSMTASTMKGMISGDITHKRLLYQNDMIELRPLSFGIAAANKLPLIHQADEAIRDRLAPILISSVFVDEGEIDNLIDDNALLACQCKYMISTTKFQISDIAQEFSNLLFEQFQTTRDTQGLIHIKINKDNINSQQLINQILIKNNTLYYILNASGICFNDDGFMSYESIQEHTLVEIEKHNETSKTKRFTWSYVKHELSLLFKHKEAADGSGIRGLGLKHERNIQSKVVEYDLLVESPETFVPWAKIKSHLYHVKKVKFNHINTIFSELKTKYSICYDSQRQGFRGYKLNVNG